MERFLVTMKLFNGDYDVKDNLSFEEVQKYIQENSLSIQQISVYSINKAYITTETIGMNFFDVYFSECRNKFEVVDKFLREIDKV